MGFQKAKAVLEFDKLLDHVAARCVSVSGKAKLLNSEPFSDAGALEEELFRLQDMRDVYQVEGGLPIWDFCDIRILLNKCEPRESFLEIKEFQQVLNFVELVEELVAFRKKLEDKYPYLQGVLRGLTSHGRFRSQLQFTFDPSGNIFDNASPELKQIRKEIAALDKEIHVRLERILRKHQEHIQEEYITVRDGRLVLPVREFSVSKISGIVHGQSGTGATYFVEPMAVVELNNQIQKLHSEEKKEIIKILRRLSRLVLEEGAVFIENFTLLNRLDVLQAKARYANETDSVLPQVSRNLIWEFIGIRHPLLMLRHPQETVPLDLKIGEGFRQLVITGPNAGGKTVALKTIGINQLLFQCGFHLPGREGTSLPICQKMFAVIGDEQSIEKDLSTFSSHVQELKEILDEAATNSLILVDEIGSGTEPSGGAALAIAFLERLNRDGIVTAATTHLNQLKVFAGETKGVRNGAMQFDKKTLSPLFSLQVGIPGSSFTLDICRRLGIDEELLQRAAELAGEEVFRLDNLLADVAHKSHSYQQLNNELSIKKTQLDGLMHLYRQKNAELKKIRKQAEKQAIKESRELFKNINKEIEAAVREVRESRGDKEIIRKARGKIEHQRSLIESMDQGGQNSRSGPEMAELSAGTKVRSIDFDISGTVTKVFKGKREVEIERQGLKLTLPVSGVEIISGAQPAVKKSPTPKGQEYAGGQNIHNELDLRGLMSEEAERSVAGYLDRAVLSSWDEIRLIHGKGSGALRQAVHRYLSKRKDIKSFRLGKWGEGDTGVTVVQLK